MEKPLTSSHVYWIVGVCAVLLLAIIQLSSAPAMETAIVPVQNQVAQVGGSPSFILSPLTSTVAANTTFTLNITLNTAGQAIYGVDINKLHFNPALLQVVDSDSATAGVQIAPGSLMSQVFMNAVDNTAGTVQFSQVANPGTTYSGSGTVASVTFRAVAQGTASVTLDFTSGSGTDSNIAGANGDILASVSGGTYTITPPDTTAPTAPGTPVLTVISATKINLTWPVSTDNTAVTGYKVERCAGAACTNFVQIGAPATASYADTGLTGSTVYRYRVLAVDAASNASAYSPISSDTTQAPPDITPPTISNIAFSGITTTGVTITWTTNEQSDTQVEYGTSATYGSASTLDAALLTSHSATLAGLLPGTSYHYRVKSKDAAGNLSNSPDNTFTTTAGPDTTAPSVPTGVKATPTSESEIQISWTASTDPTGPGQNISGVKEYQVYRGATLLTTTVSTAYLDTGLTGGTAYSYQIIAVDKADNISAKSVAVTATTPTLSLAVQRRIIFILDGAPVTKRNVTGTIEFINPSNTTKIYEASVTTDALGKYTVNVPSGLIANVNLRANVPGYLTKLATNIDLRDSTVIDITFPKLPAGDFNSDRLVNSLDFSYLNSRWGGPDALADVNRDGEVNTLDFAFLSINWALVGE
jgi:hypothetical protein